MHLPANAISSARAPNPLPPPPSSQNYATPRHDVTLPPPPPPRRSSVRFHYATLRYTAPRHATAQSVPSLAEVLLWRGPGLKALKGTGLVASAPRPAWRNVECDAPWLEQGCVRLRHVTFGMVWHRLNDIYQAFRKE